MTHGPGGTRRASTSGTPIGGRSASLVRASDSPGFLLNQATLALNAALDRALAGGGLTGAQWTVVWLLHEERATTVSELARGLGTDVAATWRLVGRLADKGFIVRQPDPTDRRLVRLQLTDAAHQAYPRWRASVADTVSRLFAGSSTEDLAALGRVCARIASNARTVTH